MSELLPPEMELHQRQDAVLEAALLYRHHHFALRALGLNCPSEAFDENAYDVALTAAMAARDALLDAATSLQAWHNENGR